MATYNSFECFVRDLGREKHDLANDAIHVYLTNAAPSANADAIRSDLAPMANGNGYNQTALTGTNWTLAANVTSFKANNSIVFTADANNFGPFRYTVMVNNNSDANANNCCLISWWDYGSAINCNNGETFTINPPANKLIFSIT